MITASNVKFHEGKIVGNASFEDVLNAVLPEEVYSDEEKGDIQIHEHQGGPTRSQEVMVRQRASGISAVSLLEILGKYL